MLERMIRRVHNRDSEGGFTLIELLVVIVILGVLAAVVVVSVSFITDRGTNAACQTDVQSIDSALQEYYTQANDYPHNAAPDTGNPFDVLYSKGYLATNPNITGNPGNSPWTWTHNGYSIIYTYTAGAPPQTPPQISVSSGDCVAGGAAGGGGGGNQFPAPTGLTVTWPGGGFRIQWSYETDAQSYTVKIHNENGTDDNTTHVNQPGGHPSTVNTFINVGGHNGQTYDISVVANYSGGSSAPATTTSVAGH